MSAEPWGRIRLPTMLRLARAQRVQPVITGAAYASIISRAKPFAKLGCQDRNEVLQWAEAGESRIPVEDYEVAAVSTASVAGEGFNGDKSNARKGIANLLNAGIIDRVSQGRRGHASLYVTFPTLADVAEGVYTVPPIAETPEPPIVENSNRGYDSVPPKSIVENSNRGYDRAKKGVRQSEIGGMGVGSDQGFQKHHQSITTDIYNRSGRSVAAAARAAPPARKNKKVEPFCPLCKVPLFRNAQTAKWDCGECNETFTDKQVRLFQWG